MAPRVLTTHPKNHHPHWQDRTELLAGWVEAAARVGARPMPWPSSVRWGWRLFRASHDYDAVVTGFERPWWVFAVLQRLRRRPRPHVMVYVSFVLPAHPLLRAVKRLYYRYVLHDFVLGSVDRIVVYSRRQIALWQRELALPPHKFVCVPYHTTLYMAPHGAPSTGDYIFAGGDFTRDYPLLIAAVRGLPHRVVIAALLRHYFVGMQVPDTVEVVTVGAERFFDLMAGARVVVVPLRGGLLHSGGQQTYLNAMALGKAVVVLDDCGADEYIEHGRTGLVLASGDEAGLRAALSRLMTDDAYVRELGERAREASRSFSPEVFFDRVLELVAARVEERHAAAGAAGPEAVR